MPHLSGGRSDTGFGLRIKHARRDYYQTVEQVRCTPAHEKSQVSRLRTGNGRRTQIRIVAQAGCIPNSGHGAVRASKQRINPCVEGTSAEAGYRLEIGIVNENRAPPYSLLSTQI